MKIQEKGIFSLLILLFAVVLLVDTMGMRSDSVLVPRLVGTVLLILSALQVWLDWFPNTATKLAFLSESTDASKSIGGEGVITDIETAEEKSRRFRFISWMILFVALIYFTSMIWAIVVAMFIYLRWITRESWRMSIIYPCVTALIIYIAFVVGLDVHYFL